MAEIDTFATQLLDEARAFLVKGRTSETPKASEAYLHAALNLAFCALEAHINAIAEDFLTLSQLSPQEQSIRRRKKLSLSRASFVSRNEPKSTGLRTGFCSFVIDFQRRPPWTERLHTGASLRMRWN